MGLWEWCVNVSRKATGQVHLTHSQVQVHTRPHHAIQQMQGGAYLTLLNTIANMGIIFPKAPLYYLVDVLTVTNCWPPHGGNSGSEAVRFQVCWWLF